MAPVRKRSRLDWPADRPRTAPEDRRLGQFSVELDDALAHLAAELDRLGAEDVVVCYGPGAWRTPDPFARWPSPNRTADPGVAVWFDLGGRRLCFTCDRWLHLRDNLRAVGLMVAAIRGLERWGAAGSAEAAFAGFAALPAGDGVPDWRGVLGLRGRVGAADIDRAYRRLAREAHPDAGGDPERFRALTAARQAAMAEATA